MSILRAVITRVITKVVLILLFGKQYEFDNIDNTLTELNSLDINNPVGEFKIFEIIIDYNNGDTVRGTFQNKALLTDFLRKL
jgi:hypothetical protein